MFGSYSQPSESEFLRHSVHTYKVVQANWQQIELSFMHQPSYTSNCVTSTEEATLFDGFSVHTNSLKNIEENMLSLNPPSIPPKKNKVSTNQITVFCLRSKIGHLLTHVSNVICLMKPCSCAHVCLTFFFCAQHLFL